MRKFVFKTLFFIFPIVLIAIIMEVSLRQIPNDYLYKKRYLDAHAKDINTLILGSSHSFYGVNPIYFSNSTFNASHISQTLNYDYEILKKYENSFTSLSTVILPISYFTLFGKLEAGTESWRVKNYIIYYGMNTSHSLKDFSEILSNRFDINFKRLGFYYIKGKTNISCSKLGWGTSYKFIKSRDLKGTGKKAALRHTKKEFKYLNENILDLKSIIELCKSHNIDVFLFTPPAYETYYKNLNTEQLIKTIEIACEMEKEYKNCLYLNLLEDNTFNAKDFYDADHLNEIGAKKLSLILNNKINHWK